MPPIDVVVPVYNGLDHVFACLESLLANTPGGDVRIIVADDASPDPAVPMLLEEIAQRDHRVVIHRRDINLGFPENCNRAIRWSDRDVVLLNSDTIVPPGWLDRLRRLAATSDRIGSITPLSNNGEIASVPVWLGDNRYPDGISVRDLDAAAQATGCGDWIEIPTGVGFCLYLTRQALDEVGVFDSAAFGRGYAEENDLCLRMRDCGYLNLLCDTVYVEHSGRVSFGAERDELITRNRRLIDARWPAYTDTIRDFIALNSLAGVQARFGIELMRKKRASDARLRVLHVLHRPLWSDVIGGTQHHVEDLATGTATHVDNIVVSHNGDAPWLQWPGMVEARGFPAAATATPDLRWIDAVLDTGVDVLHIQHMVNFPLGSIERLVEEARRRAIPRVFTIHDYFAACPGIQLLDAATREPCRSLTQPGECTGCEQLSRQLTGSNVDAWRRSHERLLHDASIIAPSASAAINLVAALPDLSPALTVVPHGIRTPRLASADDRTSQTRAGVRLAVVGSGGVHKGDDLLARLVTMPELENVEWHFYGRSQLRTAAGQGRQVFHGRYEPDEIVRLLARDGAVAVVLTPVWAETFSYTLSEAWAAGLPVFATDRGAIAERIRADGGGVLLPEEPAQIAPIIAATLSDSERMASLTAEAAAAGQALQHVDDMALRYVDLYHSLVNDQRPARSENRYEWSGVEVGMLLGSFTSPTRGEPSPSGAGASTSNDE